VLAGYSYVRPLGVGGFADVFLFEQDQPRRQVAVKVLLQDVTDEDSRRMFNAEADVMARLSAHPSILTVFDASISADGRPYIVMEYCPGSYASRYRTDRIPVAEVLSTGVRIASALETAHRAGLFHRDIKPSNVLVNSFGSPVLADFGIATSIARSAANTTGEQVFAMSVPWSAPEVVEKRITGSVGTEVWALAATLYTLLAGRTPFELEGTGRNGSEQMAARISKAKYTRIHREDAPEHLQLILARAMSHDPRQRPASMFELATELSYVQYELGLIPTAIEVATDDWSISAADVDFDDASSRGPIASTVPHTSRRATPQKRAAGRDAPDSVAAQGRTPGGSSALRWLALGTGVVVVLGVASIVAAVIIGGMT
jgi:serine/threonine protein kinase